MYFSPLGLKRACYIQLIQLHKPGQAEDPPSASPASPADCTYSLWSGFNLSGRHMQCAGGRCLPHHAHTSGLPVWHVAEHLRDVMHAPGTALSLYVFVLRKKSLREAERQVPTSLSTLSVAMHWLLASVVISLLLGVSIRQLQRGTSWRPSTSIASGPLERPRVQKISKSTLMLPSGRKDAVHQHCPCLMASSSSTS